MPEVGTRVKYTGDVANLAYTGTVTRAWKDKFGDAYMDVQPDAAPGEVVAENRGIPCHAFPETGPGKRWVLSAPGERREKYTGDYNPDLSNID